MASLDHKFSDVIISTLTSKYFQDSKMKIVGVGGGGVGGYGIQLKRLI